MFCLCMPPPSVWRLYDFPLSLPPAPSSSSAWRRRQAMSCGSCAPPVLWLSTSAVQLTVPIGDDDQLMSGGPPVLWLSTNTVQLTVPIGDDDQLMSCWLLWPAPPPYRRRLPADVVRFLRPVHPMAQYKCSTADRPYRRRRPADVRRPARAMAQYKCSTADRPCRRRLPADVLWLRRPARRMT